MRAILCCVEYSDLLAVTLPYNRRHFSAVVVVTSPADCPNVKPIADANDAAVFTTDAFYRGGATFNKFRALEEGLDWMGRSGWLCVMDADVLIPKDAEFYHQLPDGVRCKQRQPLQTGYLYGPLRHMAPWPGPVPEEPTWRGYPLHKNQGEWAGYSILFHASDPHLPPPPWHDTRWVHAGGSDSFFQRLWPPENKVRLPFNVLHLGPAGANWMGRISPSPGGGTPDKAPERARALQEMAAERRRKRHLPESERFRGERL